MPIHSAFTRISPCDNDNNKHSRRKPICTKWIANHTKRGYLNKYTISIFTL